MNPKVTELLERIRAIEEEVEREVQLRRAELNASFEQRRICFDEAVLAQQRRFRQGTLRYLLDGRLSHYLTAPIIFSAVFPMLLMDLMVSLYQWLCFPVYGIPRVRRRDYLIFDHTHLAYLNLIEMINCGYCSYANGLASYVKEIFARTEQYWCPIKHARRVLQAHPYYENFVDFGDAESYRRELEALRLALSLIDAQDGK